MLDLLNNPIYVTLYKDMNINTILIVIGYKSYGDDGTPLLWDSWVSLRGGSVVNNASYDKENNAMGFRDSYGCINFTNDIDLTWTNEGERVNSL